MTELIEIEKCERRALWIGRGRNPGRELFGLELFNLGWRPFREFVLLKIDIFRLQALLARFETTPARVSKKPESIPRGLAIGRELRRFAQYPMKNLLRLRGIRQHQKAKAIKLEQILFLFFGHADFFPAAMLRASRRSQAAMSILRHLFQAARHFFRVLAAVERRHSEITFALRAESCARCDHDVYLV